ncbi:YkuS family protein [Alicyclobacillus contaminans]|uniref:YkuS family protein n=1 Tax=Alicyclobacillus contaminans TaxID=392016 RepID=UPI0004127BB0|nr:YkuS family protein [Alicyclobacillus contaminans]
MKPVAVERGLEPVRQYLQQQGCHVVDVVNDGSAVAQQAACMCITGGDKDVMGMEDVIADIPVVNCDGLSPEQVYQRVKNYIQ